MNLTDPEDRQAASASYVIGLLDAEDLQAFETALGTDEALQTEVAFWRDRTLGLTERATSVQPSEALWSRIAESLDGAEDRESPPAKAASAAGASPAPIAAGRSHDAVRPASSFSAPRQTRSRRSHRSLWNRLGLWQGLTALSTAAAIALATYVVQRPPEVRVYMAVLKSPGQQTAGWLVQARTTGTVRLVPIDPNTIVPANKSLQVWTQPAGSTAPIPIGLIEPGESFEIPVDQLPSLAGEQLFAISLEPSGGSPTGQPTGPILFAGNTEQL